MTIVDMEYIPNGCCPPWVDHSKHAAHTERAVEKADWRTVAEALAERMANHAYACPSGWNTLGEEDEAYGPIHYPPALWADQCPHCADTVAYETYLRKAQQA